MTRSVGHCLVQAPVERPRRGPAVVGLALLLAATLVACADDDGASGPSPGEDLGPVAPADGGSGSDAETSDLGAPDRGGAPDASSDSGTPPADSGETRPDTGPTMPADPEACSPLIPSECLLPYPSMAMLRPDPGSPTGFRVALQDAMLPFPATSPAERLALLERFGAADGFSIATPILALFPGATVDGAGLPTPGDLAASLEPSAAVQIIDRITGERVPVWAELDNRARLPSARGEPVVYDDPRRTLIIRPQTALGWGRRYAVVVTDAARDVHGVPLPRPAPFAALVDGRATGVAALDARAAEFAALTDFLGQQGLARERLVLAWEFVTMSREFAQRPLRAMVDAIGALPPQEFPHTVACDAADPADGASLGCVPGEALHPTVWRRLEGTFTVPSFLDAAGRIQWEQGRPVLQGTLDVPYVVVLPPSVAAAPAGSVGLLQVGHGFMSQAWRYLMRSADDNGTLAMVDHLGVIAAGCDWIGLSTADLLELLDMIEHFDRLFGLQDRLLQGLVAQHLLLDFVRSTLASHPALAAPDPDAATLLDPTEAQYFGVSLGAILGGPYVLTSPAIDTAVLHVPSAQFSSMFQHSSEFSDFQLIVDVFYPHGPDQQGIFALAQAAFDPLDPITWHDHFVREPLQPERLPNLLWQVSKGDSNAPDFGFYALQRAAQIPLVVPTPYGVWGVDAEVQAPTGPATQGVVLYDADPVLPTLDNSLVEDNGAHNALRCSPGVYAQVADYLQPGAQGTIRLHCGGGPCFVEAIDCRTRLGVPDGARPAHPQP